MVSLVHVNRQYIVYNNNDKLSYRLQDDISLHSDSDDECSVSSTVAEIPIVSSSSSSTSSAIDDPPYSLLMTHPTLRCPLVAKTQLEPCTEVIEDVVEGMEGSGAEEHSIVVMVQ